MTRPLLLDTHILIRWSQQPDRLSKEQLRVLRNVARQSETVAISAITLWEMAQLANVPDARAPVEAERILDLIETSPMIEVVPITIAIAREAGKLKSALRDPADCLIAATARVNSFTLLTVDQRIIKSRLAVTIE
ncbi:MAG TPA: type II toxin-antitoxin system VapC family toxin [Schlesneria sp.]|jgi:PIN domain nuclease of toxin-antitoxin system